MHLHNKTVDKLQHQELSPDIEELLSRPDSDVRELMGHAADCATRDTAGLFPIPPRFLSH